MLKIIIADDHETVRDGLKTFLTEDNGFRLLAEAKNGEEAISLTLELRPDVVIMDITMPMYNGLEALEQILYINKSIKVLMFSMHSNPQYITEAYQKGAYGFLLKDTDKEEIIFALHKIAVGEKYFGSSVANTILDNLEKAQAKSKMLDMLTKRELEVLKLLKTGLNNDQIAGKLFLSKRTIDTHKANIKSKLDLKNSYSLITLAYELDL
jgi:DNA-binding NarL/FixJ family response regulator